MTHSALQFGLALSGILVGLGLAFGLTGGGLIWATRARDDGDELDLRHLEDAPRTTVSV